jgi:undecaprenyl diphosphate synthase
MNPTSMNSSPMFKDQINKETLPQHIAIIMDGNGRWAKSQGKPRIFGHRSGADAVRRVVEAGVEVGINYLTLYTFSKENWQRSQTEVNSLMTLLLTSLNNETKTLMENNVRLFAIGDLNNLPSRVQKKLNHTIHETSENTGMTLTLALSYGARWEILNAIRQIAQKVNEKMIKPEEIDEQLFRSFLMTHEIPDPELLIRTSGENRISNFLLFQIAYSELFFTRKFWPDFQKEDFYEAIVDYQCRERRFGKTSEQLKTIPHHATD